MNRGVQWRDEASAVIILAAPGYPGTPQKGIPLALPQPAGGEFIFHAGTAEQEGQLVSSGGRVLAVTPTAAELPGVQRLVCAPRHDVVERTADGSRLGDGRQAHKANDNCLGKHVDGVV